MEVSAGSTTEEPGSSSARQLFLPHFPSGVTAASDMQALGVTAAHGQVPAIRPATGQKPIHYPPISAIMKAPDTYIHLQATTGSGEMTMSMTCTIGRNRLTLMTPKTVATAEIVLATFGP